ncbi:hypothetical protein [Bradyrhizobium sp. OAE829]|uniref:hypothetical protein n=1 Tax=Bradyrhizobium sp. OAE829 TaxID=2663807 RepID=UPI00178AF60A
MLVWLSNQIYDCIVKENRDANANAPTWEEICIEEARAGHPQGLQKLYPHFADCISSPKRSQGQNKYSNYEMIADVAETAAEYARHIRALWRKQYGKLNRTRDERQAGISAEHFAVDICKEYFGKEAAGLTVEAVLAAAKPSGPPSRVAEKRRRQTAKAAR